MLSNKLLFSYLSPHKHMPGCLPAFPLITILCRSMSLGRAEIPALCTYKHGVSYRCCRAASPLLNSRRWSVCSSLISQRYF